MSNMAVHHSSKSAEHYTPLAPPVKWVGGKSSQSELLNFLAEIAAPAISNGFFVEPFVGGGSVSLSLRPAHAIIADANPDLIAMWQWLQKGGTRKLSTPTSPEGYRELRDWFNGGLFTDSSRGEAFYLLINLGFNGLCRYNQKGKFNVPAGAKSNGSFQTLPEDRATSDYADVLKNWHIVPAQSWECTIAQVVEMDRVTNCDYPATLPIFFYCDPPYHSENDKGFTGYTGTKFDWESQLVIARILAEQTHGFALSNQATAQIVDLYYGFANEYELEVKFFDNARGNSISCKGSSRTAQQEILLYRSIN